MKIIKHTGWGRTSKTISSCYSVDEFILNPKIINSSALPVGLGRSYGDSSTTNSGVYLSSAANTQIEINYDEKFAVCGSGATIGDLERASIKQGLFPMTVPGTEFVTIGGATASNIHGKSHHSVGSFAESIVEIEMLTSSNEIISLNPTGVGAKYFWATVGGMGLTGVITRVKLKLFEVETPYIKCQENRSLNLRETMDILKEFDEKYLYTVAWIDLSGDFRGRGRVIGGNHAKKCELPKNVEKLNSTSTKKAHISLPDVFPSRLVNRFSIKIFNFFWFNKPLKEKILDYRSFLHPLDIVGNWNFIYGKKGLVQFQFLIPYSAEFYLEKVLVEFKKAKASSFLGVLKSFGKSDKSLLGFPSPGWTLSIDIPATNTKAINVIKELSYEIAELGGKVYLAKDSLLEKNVFESMYPTHTEWKKYKKALDSKNMWRSDQGIRLGLC